ncbi:Disease resistance protein [Quillaja saponaria]|uniref:Disease resistance protein n=1 Tax=Quillaja saponaria TaxID=32244 RepID=A0AAD7LQD3_QUISA|nr:Disease resistance protein [Quillaja saponaria]
MDEMLKEATNLYVDGSHSIIGCSHGFCLNILSRHQLSTRAKKMAKGNCSTVSFRPTGHETTVATLVTTDYKALESRTITLTQIMEKLKEVSIQRIGVWGLGFGWRDVVNDLNIQPVAIEVARRCVGLPVLITTVAKALMDKQLYAWNDALKQLERFDKEGMHTEVYLALELSFNHLKGEEIKSLILLIAFHGQFHVSKHDLLIIGVGMGLFKNVDTLEDVRNRLRTLTNDLKTSCLLIEDEREWVKIHDVVCDAAISIAAKDKMFRMDFDNEFKEWPGTDHLRRDDKYSCGLLFYVIGLFDMARLQPGKTLIVAIAAKVAEYTVAPVGRQLGYQIFYKGNGEEIESDVQSWLDGVDEMVKEATNLYVDGSHSNSGCSHGFCLNILSRYQLSMRAKKMAHAVNEIQAKGNFSTVSFRPTGHETTIATLVTTDYKALESRTITLTQIMEKLKDVSIQRIGVWGLGGVGKTMLAKQIATLANECELLDRVVMATATVNPDVRWIQGEIGDGHKGSKVLLISRSYDVLKREMRIQVGFWLEVLPENEAWSLFEENTGDVVNDLNIQLVAIEVLYAWNDALKQLERFDKEGMHTEVYLALELSLNHLKGEEIKSLFLLIALHGQFHVSKHDLLIIGVGMGLFKNVDTLEDVRNRLHTLTNDLKTSCLLIEDEREDLVKLNLLVLVACSAVEEILTMKDSSCEEALFPNLESLNISAMDNLRTIWDHRVSSNSFSKLKQIHVTDGGKLVTILSSKVVRNFHNLDILKVDNCNSVEEIFYLRELRDQRTDVGEVPCHLKHLTLRRLSKLKHIWNEDPKGILKAFQNLQNVKAKDCENLNYIFPASVAKCLLQLEKFKIDSCGVTEIVAGDEGSNEGIRFLFPQAKHISIMRLPKLKNFYPRLMDILEWSMLKELHVSEINETLISSSQVSDYQWNGFEMHGQQLFFLAEKSLHLWGKTAMTLYLNGQFQDLFHNLKILSLHDCSRLRSLVTAAYSSVPFQNVHTLEIKSCDGLINLVTLSTVKSSLSVRKLGTFLFAKLGNFWPEKCTLQFPFLKKVIAVACFKMEMFSPGAYLKQLKSTTVLKIDPSNYEERLINGCTRNGSVDRYGKPALKDKTSGWRSAILLLVNQGLVTIAFAGVEVNMVLFSKSVLRQTNAEAANTFSRWMGTANRFSLIGAFLSDSYLGRFITSVIFQVVNIVICSSDCSLYEENESLSAPKWRRAILCARKVR